MTWRLLWRDFRNRPGFWLAATLTLASGLGSVAAIFSLIDSILLRPLPFPEPDRLVAIRVESEKLRGQPRQNSLPDFEDWRRAQSVFSSMGLAEQERVTLLWDGRGQMVSLARVTPDFFPTLGIGAWRGRTFLPEEDQPGGDSRKMVLSHSLWQSRFGGDPGIIGRQLRTAYGTVTVVGIMPAGFSHPDGVQAWMPVQARLDLRRLQRTDERSFRSQLVVARLKPGVSLEQAGAQMRALGRDLERRYPVTNEAMYPVVDSLHEVMVGSMRQSLGVLMAAVGLLLAIAVVNVASLMLVRVAGRFQELTLRGALGAPPRALLAGPTGESLAVALGGWLAGLAGAWAFLRRFPEWVPVELPGYIETGLSPAAAGMTLAVAMLAAVGAALLPARAALGANAAEVLRESGRGIAGHHRWLGWLVAGEMALTFVLLVGAALLVKSFRSLEQVDPGFAPERVMTLQVTANVPGVNNDRIRQSTQLMERITRRVAALPAVEAVGGTDRFPFTDFSTRRHTLIMEARGDGTEQQHRAPATLIDVTPDYFRAMQIPLKEGRFFREDEDLTKPWTIILSERAARAMFPGRPALGQQVRLNTTGSQDPWATVVGVVGNVRYRADESEQTLEFYYPAKQYGLSQTRLAVRLRRDLTPGDAAMVREAVMGEDPETPVEDVRALPDLMARTLWQPRLWSRLLTGFALVAVLLSAVGLYGMLAYAVERQRPEIGVRMSFGATPAEIRRWMTLRGLRIVGLGLGAGLGGALAAGRLMESLLFGVAWWDPWVIGGAALGALAIGVLAGQVPAWRASRVDPLVALRSR